MTEGIMAHAMTYYAAISACSMGGICIPAMRSHTFIFKSLISVVKGREVRVGMTSPRGMRCLCVALDVLTLSCCYQRVREEPDAGRDQLQRSHQRLQRDRRDCSHQRQNPRAASAPSNCAGCGPCPRARQGGTCTRAQRCAEDRFKIMLMLL